MSRKNCLFVFVFLSFLFQFSFAQNNGWESKKQVLFETADRNVPYRIPAIATTSDQHVIAVTDYRLCGKDIGHGEVDIKFKRSASAGMEWDGKSWSQEMMLADGKGGNGFDCGFGDAAMVADRESGKVLVMCVAGKVFYGNTNKNNRSRIARIVSEDNGQTWKTPVEVTSQFIGGGKAILPEKVVGMFFGAGRLLQSRIVKKGQYFRIYGAVLARRIHKDNWLWVEYAEDNYVVYSDDFGQSWKMLGGGSAVSGGNEPKVEELSDGTIVISSRKGNGRYFNLFTFSDLDKAEGKWGTAVASDKVGDLKFGNNSTNGEILFYPNVYDANGQKTNILLQSVPTGNERADIKVFYRSLNEKSYTPTSIAQNWKEGLFVQPGSAAYSTMTILPNGEIGFLYENNYWDDKKGRASADITYLPLTVEEITEGAFTTKNPEKPDTPEEISVAVKQAQQLYALQGVGYPAMNAKTRLDLKKLIAAPTTVRDINKAINAYCNEVNEIQMPVDGKHYRIVNVLQNGNRQYFGHDAQGALLITPDEAKAEVYICKATDKGKYNFVIPRHGNNYYMIWKGPEGKDNNGKPIWDQTLHGFNDNKGFLKGYNATYCDFVVEKLKPSVHIPNGQSDLMGYVALKGWRYSRNEAVYFTLLSKGFDASTDPFYNSTYSSAFLLEEVDCSVTPKTATIDGKELKITTFSASYPAVVPENMSVYALVQNAPGKVVLKLVGRAGDVIPANSGVLLATDRQADFVMHYAADATRTINMGGNLLQGTSGSSRVFTSEDNVFILANGKSGIGFYPIKPGSILPANRAYMVCNPNEPFSVYEMSFDETTGVDRMEIPESTVQIYTLTGVRVVPPLQPGVYIKNGRKFIIK